MRRLSGDTRGDATFLSLFFLLLVGISFLSATSQISRGVAIRSQLTRFSDEIAVKVSVAGLVREQVETGVVSIDHQVAQAIAADVLQRAGVQGVVVDIDLVNGEVVVRATFGDITASSWAMLRRIR